MTRLNSGFGLSMRRGQILNAKSSDQVGGGNCYQERGPCAVKLFHWNHLQPGDERARGMVVTLRTDGRPLPVQVDLGGTGRARGQRKVEIKFSRCHVELAERDAACRNRQMIALVQARKL